MDREEMTNDETLNPKEDRMTKPESLPRYRPMSRLFGFRTFFCHWSFVIRHFPALALFITACVTEKVPGDSARTRPVYPLTRKTNVVDDYHGVKVADPYRWLEDDNSPETKVWVEAENKVTFGYLQKI